MVEFSTVLIQEDYGKLCLKNVEVNKNFGIAMVQVPEDVDVLSNNALNQYLLKMKSDLVSMNFPEEITFVLYKENEAYAYGVDQCQRFSCRLEDPAQYMTNMLLTKKEGWVCKMIEASKISKEFENSEVTVTKVVVTPEEAVRICKERLGVI